MLNGQSMNGNADRLDQVARLRFDKQHALASDTLSASRDFFYVAADAPSGGVAIFSSFAAFEDETPEDTHARALVYINRMAENLRTFRADMDAMLEQDASV